MDLLGKEVQKKENKKGKKIVLMLLILSIILLFLVVVMIFALGDKETKTLKLSVNGIEIPIVENMLINGENGKTYISLKLLSELIGYEYLGGGYLEYNDTDKTKCYLDNNKQIIGFEANSNKIYKTAVNSSIDYQYYELKNNIIQQNDMLYIALDDLNVGTNVVYGFSEPEYKININTVEYLAKQYTENPETQESNYKPILESFNNQKAICYDMIVVANENEKMGVIDSAGNSKVGNRYSTIEFDEATQTFIVSSDNRYGVISKDGKLIIDLKYEELSIINYNPLLYKIKNNNKYGIINAKGEVIIAPEFDKIGYEQSSNINESVIIIKDVNGDEDGIVVNKEGKYGIANIENGEMITNCDVDKIYSKIDSSNQKKYYIELQGKEFDLSEYIEYVNTTTVNLNQ